MTQEPVNTQTSRQALQSALHKFMDALRLDLKAFLVEDVPFVCKVDVHLGAPDKYKDQIMKYGEILSEIMKTVPTEYFPQISKEEIK